MTVPICPFPLVTSCDNLPLSYVATNVRPSSLKDNTPPLSSSQFVKSASDFVFGSDKAGYSCSTFSSFGDSSLNPTLMVGLSGMITPVDSSNAVNSSKSASHS